MEKLYNWRARPNWFPKEFLEKGQELKVQILEVSRENRRISLGIKQLENDPWPDLIKEFEVGREVEGKIVKMDVKIGDRVLFGKWSGTEVKIDGKEYSIMKESDIMGITKSK